ncbi:MAG: DEAD/DEAH box helicase [Thermonemataceae bacterium]
MPFSDFKLNKQLLYAVAEAGYTTPTEIQEKAIPTALAGQDILGIAQTGTGKTAAFLLPILMKLKYAQGDHPRALVLAPTRELAMQIQKAAQALSTYTDLRHLVLYGGTGIQKQIEAIQKGVDLIIATPGRFMDVYLKQGVVVKYLKTLVLDEADRMMDMGFMPQIRRILEILPQKKQKLLFSATFPPKVEKLSQEFLEFPTKIEITPQATTASTVEQYLYEVPNHRTKIALLHHLLAEEAFEKVIVFNRTKKVANEVYKFLVRKFGKEEVKVIHANKDQNTRINAINAFRDNQIRILVATDVVARGIDVSAVSHVINFDVPILYEEYVHRIGRTGRAKQSGKAITFVNEAEAFHIKKIETLIKASIPRKALPTELPYFETSFEEKQQMARAIDTQKKKENPDFKGAFHEKKKKNLRNKRKRK